MKESSSYPTSKTIMPNLNFIKWHGIRKFIKQQEKRIKLLEVMLQEFNDGRSRSFYCKAAALLAVKDLEHSLRQATQKVKAEPVTDMKIRAKVLKSILFEKLLNKDLTG